MLGLLLRFWPYLAAVLAVLSGVIYIDHVGYERAKTEQATAQAKADKIMTARFNALQSHLDDEMQKNNDVLTSTIDNISTMSRVVIQPALQKELAHAPRYSNPSLGISDELRQTINKARQLSGAANATQADARPVPTTSTAK